MTHLNILVTNRIGYIGSHTIVELINVGHSVVVVDNLVNSSQKSLRRVETIIGVRIPFYKLDIHDCAELGRLYPLCRYERPQSR